MGQSIAQVKCPCDVDRDDIGCQPYSEANCDRVPIFWETEFLVDTVQGFIDEESELLIRCKNSKFSGVSIIVGGDYSRQPKDSSGNLVDGVGWFNIRADKDVYNRDTHECSTSLQYYVDGFKYTQYATVGPITDQELSACQKIIRDTCSELSLEIYNNDNNGVN